MLWKRFLRILKTINNLHREVPLRRIRKHWKMVVCVILLCVGAGAGSLHLYRSFKQHRLLANAAAALRDNDPHAAAIFAVKALQADPKSVAAVKIIAEAADARWPRDALAWHARWEELQPGNLENCLAWARTALKLNDPATARRALDKSQSPEAGNADYQWLAGQVALAQKDYDTAAADFAKAVDLSPGSVDYAFSLARVRLLLPEEARQLGVQSLEALAAKPGIRLQALRILADDAASHREQGRALDYFTRIEQDPGATPRDRLLRLDFLLRSHNRAFASELSDAEKKVQSNPDEVANLAFWMNENKMPLVAIEWVTNLPAALRSNTKLQLALALSYVDMRDWPSLRPLLDGGDWKELDFLRIALLARCFGEEGDAQRSQDQWNLAVLKASESPQSLGRLCETIQGWGSRWEPQAEELGWKIVASPNAPLSVFDAMQTRFITNGETQKFRQLLVRWHEIDPVDRVVRNNLALVYLLLNHDDKEARQAALKLFQENPSDGGIGSTFAFSLYLQGRASEALDIMSRFPSELRVPSYALYNGVFLVACREPEQADRFLRFARKAPFLLPEERELLAAAEASVKGGAPKGASN